MKDSGLVALVLGGTGLVGSELVQLLIKDERFEKILVIGRRSHPIKHDKVSDLIIDFDQPEEWKHLIQGDALFMAFGTTLKKAGSKENQYRIDYTYQYNIAEAAVNNGVETCVLVSAAGAKVNSAFFYNRIKGELDRDVTNMAFKNIVIIKPSLLVGDRQEHRSGEKIAAVLGAVLKYLPGLQKFRPIHGSIVAKAMVQTGLTCKGKSVFVAGELFDQAKKY